MTVRRYEMTEASARRILVALAERAVSTTTRGDLSPEELFDLFDGEGMASHRNFTRWATDLVEYLVRKGEADWVPIVLRAIRWDWDRARDVRSAAAALHALLSGEA